MSHSEHTDIDEALRKAAEEAAKRVANNRDEQELEDEHSRLNLIGNYHKGLPHDDHGEVDPGAYLSLLRAVLSGKPADFEAIPLGYGRFGRKLTNPQAGLATDLEGPKPADPDLTMAPPPRLGSAAEAAEAVELYWMALLRDVAFERFDDDPLVHLAASELTGTAAAREGHPQQASAIVDGLHPSPAGVLDERGRVTPGTIFRGVTAGDHAGPFVSQFLLKDIPYGSLTISQRQQTVLPRSDYLTDFGRWLAVQNGFGNVLAGTGDFDSKPRHLRNMRDLGQYVHVDALYEAYLNACLILLAAGTPFDQGIPYGQSRNQAGFATFGGPHILSLVCEVATRALKAVWYQKWIVHRRLRPEAFGGLVHLHLTGKRPCPLHEDIADSEAVRLTFHRNGTFLLPMAFPEGSPTHPAYGAGHATVAGACVTILKAWFDEDHLLADPKVASEDGMRLVPYTGIDADRLTVRGELDKVAANVAIGRNMAGVHWRSDYTASIALGERVAIEILRQQSCDYNERSGPLFDELPSFTLTRFDGTKVRISNGEVIEGIVVGPEVRLPGAGEEAKVRTRSGA
jgi:hypothetical protein